MADSSLVWVGVPTRIQVSISLPRVASQQGAQSRETTPQSHCLRSWVAPPRPVVTINEMTTVASVWTNNQFLDGTAISGTSLGLRIAAGNVPNFVDLATGGYGVMIQDGFNSTQTPTMANFATLSSVLAGCVNRVKADACNSLFAAATGPEGNVPSDTLAAAHSIARNSGFKPNESSRCWMRFIQCRRANTFAPPRTCLI